MQHTLKLTITAVGEDDSVFLTPCDPVTLYESSVEEPDAEDGAADQQAAAPESAGPDDTPPAGADDQVMVLVDG